MSSLGHQLTTSVPVVGTGASGLRAAVEVAEAGVRSSWSPSGPAKTPRPARRGTMPSGRPPLPALATPGSGTRLRRRGRAAVEARTADIAVHIDIRRLLGSGARLRPQTRAPPGDHPVCSGAAPAPGLPPPVRAPRRRARPAGRHGVVRDDRGAPHTPVARPDRNHRAVTRRVRRCRTRCVRAIDRGAKSLCAALSQMPGSPGQEGTSHAAGAVDEVAADPPGTVRDQ